MSASVHYLNRPRPARFARLRRWLRGLVAAALLIGAAILAWMWTDDGAQTERWDAADSPPARAVDGDTIMLLGEAAARLRLGGIDAPELRQSCARADGSRWACGLHAYAALGDMLLAPGVSCTLGARDDYGRRIADCTAPAVGNISAAMVRRGLAVATGSRDLPRFVVEEEQARRARRGVWQGRFDRPDAWRSAHPRQP